MDSIIGILRAYLGRRGYVTYQIDRGEEYMPCPPQGYVTYAPWFTESFRLVYSHVRDNTVVREDRCYIIEKLCEYCVTLGGDVAECGVYRGGTAHLMAGAVARKGPHGTALRLFDTFAGMPALVEDDPSGHVQEDFSDTSLEAVKEFLSEFDFVDFYPGLMPDTFGDAPDCHYAFVHVDVDLYSTALDCCRYFYDRLLAGGMIVFDDYGFMKYRLAEKKAVDDFFADKPEEPIALPTGQAIIIKIAP